MQYKMENPVKGSIQTEKYQCTIEWRNGKIIADEPASLGGKDTGPDPYTLLLSSLISCKLITLRMYIDRKQWDIPNLTINANMYQETKNELITSYIDCDLIFPESVPDDQRLRLQEIAKNCPVSKILQGEVKVRMFAFRAPETKTIRYGTEDITVEWKPELCQHSTRCWKQLPQVFKPSQKKWIEPDGAPKERLEEQIKRCPSGALVFIDNNKAT
jgi:putative redox protein